MNLGCKITVHLLYHDKGVHVHLYHANDYVCPAGGKVGQGAPLNKKAIFSHKRIILRFIRLSCGLHYVIPKW